MINALTSTVLYGMKNAGKTTLGEGLALHLGQPFVDTDRLIEEEHHERYGGELTCEDIIRGKSSAFFQALQAEVVLAHVPTEPEVIATGGTVGLKAELVEHLAQFGVSIFVRVAPNVLDGRFSNEDRTRITQAHGLSVVDLYESRIPIFEAASDSVLDVTQAEPQSRTLERLIELRKHYVNK